MFRVYYQERLTSHNNLSKETWVYVIKKEFDTEKEAKAYILEKTKYLPEYTKLTDGIHDSQFLRKFCFDENYLAHQRYFIGKPDPVKMKKALQREGINSIVPAK